MATDSKSGGDASAIITDIHIPKGGFSTGGKLLSESKFFSKYTPEITKELANIGVKTTKGLVEFIQLNIVPQYALGTIISNVSNLWFGRMLEDGYFKPLSKTIIFGLADFFKRDPNVAYKRVMTAETETKWANVFEWERIKKQGEDAKPAGNQSEAQPPEPPAAPEDRQPLDATAMAAMMEAFRLAMREELERQREAHQQEQATRDATQAAAQEARHREILAAVNEAHRQELAVLEEQHAARAMAQDARHREILAAVSAMPDGLRAIMEQANQALTEKLSAIGLSVAAIDKTLQTPNATTVELARQIAAIQQTLAGNQSATEAAIGEIPAAVSPEIVSALGPALKAIEETQREYAAAVKSLSGLPEQIEKILAAQTTAVPHEEVVLEPFPPILQIVTDAVISGMQPVENVLAVHQLSLGALLTKIGQVEGLRADLSAALDKIVRIGSSPDADDVPPPVQLPRLPALAMAEVGAKPAQVDVTDAGNGQQPDAAAPVANAKARQHSLSKDLSTVAVLPETTNRRASGKYSTRGVVLRQIRFFTEYLPHAIVPLAALGVLHSGGIIDFIEDNTGLARSSAYSFMSNFNAGKMAVAATTREVNKKLAAVFAISLGYDPYVFYEKALSSLLPNERERWTKAFDRQLALLDNAAGASDEAELDDPQQRTAPEGQPLPAGSGRIAPAGEPEFGLEDAADTGLVDDTGGEEGSGAPSPAAEDLSAQAAGGVTGAETGAGGAADAVVPENPDAPPPPSGDADTELAGGADNNATGFSAASSAVTSVNPQDVGNGDQYPVEDTGSPENPDVPPPPSSGEADEKLTDRTDDNAAAFSTAAFLATGTNPEGAGVADQDPVDDAVSLENPDAAPPPSGDADDELAGATAEAHTDVAEPVVSPLPAPAPEKQNMNPRAGFPVRTIIADGYSQDGTPLRNLDFFSDENASALLARFAQIGVVSIEGLTDFLYDNNTHNYPEQAIDMQINILSGPLARNVRNFNRRFLANMAVVAGVDPLEIYQGLLNHVLAAGGAVERKSWEDSFRGIAADLRRRGYNVLHGAVETVPPGEGPASPPPSPLTTPAPPPPAAGRGASARGTAASPPRPVVPPVPPSPPLVVGQGAPAKPTPASQGLAALLASQVADFVPNRPITATVPPSPVVTKPLTPQEMLAVRMRAASVDFFGNRNERTGGAAGKETLSPFAPDEEPTFNKLVQFYSGNLIQNGHNRTAQLSSDEFAGALRKHPLLSNTNGARREETIAEFKALFSGKRSPLDDNGNLNLHAFLLISIEHIPSAEAEKVKVLKDNLLWTDAMRGIHKNGLGAQLVRAHLFTIGELENRLERKLSGADRSGILTLMRSETASDILAPNETNARLLGIITEAMAIRGKTAAAKTAPADVKPG